MPLLPGTWLGPYQIVAPTRSDMGEVFRGRDVGRGRDVAIKVLPSAAHGDPKALARIVLEAKAVASLSHPNILAVHDVGEAEGVRYAVTELLDGETLRSLLSAGPLPQRRALDIAQQIAAALAAAHERGFVHRDIRPGNVLLVRGDEIKVIDFGLAGDERRSTGAEDSRSPTASGLAGPDTVAATVAYMSPEQARATPVDYRSDQFSLGVVLYEMLSGHSPFQRGSAAETLAAIIRDEPEPLSKHVPEADAPVRYIVERLLSKEPEGRYTSSRDLARDLEKWRLHSSEGGVPHDATSPEGLGRRAIQSVGAALLVGIGLGIAAVFHWRPAPPPSPEARSVVRSLVDIRPATSLTTTKQIFSSFTRVYQTAISLSPDGRLLAFGGIRDGEARLYLRHLDQDDAVPVSGSEDSTVMSRLRGPSPFFSADGGSLGFWAKGSLRRVPVGGGPSVPMLEGLAPAGAVFAEDGSVLFGTMRDQGVIMRIPASGGPPLSITRLDRTRGEINHRLPNLLPGERGILYTAIDDELDPEGWSIVAQRLPGGERRVLVTGASDGRYVPTGHLVYARQGSLFAVPFDAQRLTITGPAIGIAENVMHAAYVNQEALNSGAAQYAFSASGSLAYIEGGREAKARRVPVWVTRDGKVSPIEGLPSAVLYGGAFSPDGRQILFSSSDDGRLGALILDLNRKTVARVPLPAAGSCYLWTRDGRGVACTTWDRATVQIIEVSLDERGPTRTLYSVEREGGNWIQPCAYTADGKALILHRADRSEEALWLLSLLESADPSLTPLVPAQPPGSYANPALSPDGRLLAYQIKDQVFVQSLEAGEDRQQVSAKGGEAPAWSPGGGELFYLRRGPHGTAPALFSVSVSRIRPTVLGPERWVLALPEELVITGLVGGNVQPSPDGKRFVLILNEKFTEPAARTRIRLVQNWFDELKAQTAASTKM